MEVVFPCRIAVADLHSRASLSGHRAGLCHAIGNSIVAFRFGLDAGVLVTRWPKPLKV